MKIDRYKLMDELTDAFIAYQYGIEDPFPSPCQTPAVKLLRYNTDPVFRSKVKSLTFGVMTIVEKHLTQE